MTLQIDNPTIESYFHDSKTIEKILEFIAINKISIDKEEDLTQKLYHALHNVSSLIQNNQSEKKARDFLNKLQSTF